MKNFNSLLIKDIHINFLKQQSLHNFLLFLYICEFMQIILTGNDCHFD